MEQQYFYNTNSNRIAQRLRRAKVWESSPLFKALSPDTMNTPTLLTLAALCSLASLNAGQLTNPGFESELSEWKVQEKQPVSSLTKEAAHEGTLGLHLAGPGARLESERLDVVPGQKVTLEFWARATTNGLGVVMLVPYGGNKRPILNEKNSPPVVIVLKKSEEWTPYKTEFIAPENAVYIGIWVRSWSGAKGEADLDDFSLKIE